MTERPGAVTAALPRGTIFGIGLNYRDHARQQGYPIPDQPAVFLKHPGTVIGDGAAIELLFAEAGRYEIETELALVLGAPLRDATDAEARTAIAGWAVANDVSDRVLQRVGQVALGKGHPTFCPLGPWVRLDEGEAAQERMIRTWIDDVLVQECSTAEMIHSPAEIICFLSRHVALEPGDVVLTGTPGATPEGLSRGLSICAGDRITSEIEGIGRICNSVRIRGTHDR